MKTLKTVVLTAVLMGSLCIFGSAHAEFQITQDSTTGMLIPHFKATSYPLISTSTPVDIATGTRALPIQEQIDLLNKRVTALEKR